ncbi:MAG: MotA/TolQ/ExbB proton channel family protein [bacterium]
MTEYWHSFSPEANGFVFMWILLITAGFMIAIAIERTYYLYLVSNIDVPKFMSQIRKLLAAKDLKQAITLCRKVQNKVLPRIILKGFLRLQKAKGSKAEYFQNAVDEATLEVLPKLQNRTNYLAMIGNISTLIGLMGTIYGLILAFRSVSVPGIDAAQKSTMLAHGISVAMNTTLTGLSISIPSILIYTILHNKTISIIDEIDEHTVKLINILSR